MLRQDAELGGNEDHLSALPVGGATGSSLSAAEFRSKESPSATRRIILFDQRNCGRSRPHAGDPGVSLAANTTWHLVADIERLRELLGIERWLVFGGSWGSTLALAYARRHPGRVSELVLRGIYLASAADEAWAFTGTGAARLFPEEWAAFRDHIPAEERDDMVHAYHRRLFDPDPAVHVPAAHAWAAWELSANWLLPVPPPALDDRDVVGFSRVEAHYFSQGCFLRDGELLDVGAIRHIPCVIVNGRYDMKTPPQAAWDLHLAWPEADFQLVDDAGHAGAEPGTLHRLVAATDRFRGGA
ncbi:prolyl aminopeptidase [Nonomuraea sp. KC401]|uniref:prolyl aminopeptidase n=1 Tax=unclassified Nonomuraea TaxID=2593643 RepID=UPI0010FD1D29|nr:prolyl aminopeptidase [Nonomuraea sp. KC401]NBE95554.1 prolyl aminopeptidase [Nonomuraea sp. K271]TLF70827.1 prolyl aminopeptidase [Nonomuraea sp. KC401]